MRHVDTSKRAQTPGETRGLIKRLLDEGMTPRQVAKVLDLSIQAVHYHRKKLREEGDAA